MRNRFQRFVDKLRRDERGLTTVEYVIVLCLIAVVSVGMWDKLGSNVYGYLTGATDSIDTAMQSGASQ